MSLEQLIFHASSSFENVSRKGHAKTLRQTTRLQSHRIVTAHFFELDNLIVPHKDLYRLLSINDFSSRNLSLFRARYYQYPPSSYDCC